MILQVSTNAPEYYECSQFEKTDEFREKYKERAGIERKNAEMKRFHGLARARGYGLRSVSLQAKLTAIAVNLKRIAKMVSSSDSKNTSKKQFINTKYLYKDYFRQRDDHRPGKSSIKTPTFSVVSNRPLSYFSFQYKSLYNQKYLISRKYL